MQALDVLISPASQESMQRFSGKARQWANTRGLQWYRKEGLGTGSTFTQIVHTCKYSGNIRSLSTVSQARAYWREQPLVSSLHTQHGIANKVRLTV